MSVVLDPPEGGPPTLAKGPGGAGAGAGAGGTGGAGGAGVGRGGEPGEPGVHGVQGEATTADGAEWSTAPGGAGRWAGRDVRSDRPSTRARIGSAIAVFGALALGFVAFQLWVSDVVAERSQRELSGEFAGRLQIAAALASGQSLAAAEQFGQAVDLTATEQEIPPLTGEVESRAAAQLEEKGWEVVRVPEPSRTAIPGTVIRTIPAAGETLELEEDVTLVVATTAKGSPVAAIAIPEIRLNTIVVEGTGASQLAAGPGHYRASPLPGEAGNSVIMGRRTTYGAPFARIDELGEGDVITVTTLSGVFRYEVKRMRVVEPGEPDVVGPSARNLLTLVTAHPEFSATDRLVVEAELDGEPILTAASARQRAAAAAAAEAEPGGSDEGDESGAGEGAAAADPPATDPVAAGASTAGAPVLTPDELGRSNDVTAWFPALLWGELLLVAIVIAARLYRRWQVWPAWLLTTPVILALAVLWFESLTRLLPSTL